MESAERDRDEETETDTGQTAVRASKPNNREPHPGESRYRRGHEQMNLESEQARNFCM